MPLVMRFSPAAEHVVISGVVTTAPPVCGVPRRGYP
jgi:hypothetical protein